MTSIKLKRTKNKFDLFKFSDEDLKNAEIVFLDDKVNSIKNEYFYKQEYEQRWEARDMHEQLMRLEADYAKLQDAMYDINDQKRKEQSLRARHPGLSEAYEKYLTMLRLVDDGQE